MWYLENALSAFLGGETGTHMLQMDTLEERYNINSLRLSAITIQNRRKHQVMKYYSYRFNKKMN